MMVASARKISFEEPEMKIKNEKYLQRVFLTLCLFFDAIVSFFLMMIIWLRDERLNELFLKMPAYYYITPCVK